MLSLMLVVICLGFVVGGTLSFLISIGSSLPSLGLLSIMMEGMVLLLILWFGLLVLIPKGVGWFMRFGTELSCLGRLVFGTRSALMFLHLLSVLRSLPSGLIPMSFG